MSNEISTQPGRPSLLAKFGARYSLEPQKVYETLCKTAFASAKSQEQVVALLVVADQYGLNPFTREIYAFPDKGGGVVPVVGIDGWNRIAQQHPQFDGVELHYSETTKTPSGGKPCPEWVEAVVYRKDREHPIVIREYLDECYRPTPAWQSHTKRMLRHKALIQGYRTAFGFHGIYDPDEAEAITEHGNGRDDGFVPVAQRVAERIGASVDADTGEVLEGEVVEEAQGGTETGLSGDETPVDVTVAAEDAQGRREAEEQPPGAGAAEFRRARREETAERLPSEMAAGVAAKAAERAGRKSITAAQANKVYTQCTIAKIADDELYAWLGDVLGVATVEAIPAARLDEVLTWVKGHRGGAEA